MSEVIVSVEYYAYLDGVRINQGFCTMEEAVNFANLHKQICDECRDKHVSVVKHSYITEKIYSTEKKTVYNEEFC